LVGPHLLRFIDGEQSLSKGHEDLSILLDPRDLKLLPRATGLLSIGLIAFK
jgi:hypothetical protein